MYHIAPIQQILGYEINLRLKSSKSTQKSIFELIKSSAFSNKTHLTCFLLSLSYTAPCRSSYSLCSCASFCSYFSYYSSLFSSLMSSFPLSPLSYSSSFFVSIICFCVKYFVSASSFFSYVSSSSLSFC